MHSFELAEDSDYSHISRSRDKYGISGEKNIVPEKYQRRRWKTLEAIIA